MKSSIKPTESALFLLCYTRHPCRAECGLTLGDGVEVGLLAHGGQQGQGTDVDPYLGVAALLPGVVLDHVEHPADQVQHAVLRVILHTKEEAVKAQAELPSQSLQGEDFPFMFETEPQR